MEDEEWAAIADERKVQREKEWEAGAELRRQEKALELERQKKINDEWEANADIRRSERLRELARQETEEESRQAREALKALEREAKRARTERRQAETRREQAEARRKEAKTKQIEADTKRRNAEIAQVTANFQLVLDRSRRQREMVASAKTNVEEKAVEKVVYKETDVCLPSSFSTLFTSHTSQRPIAVYEDDEEKMEKNMQTTSGTSTLSSNVAASKAPSSDIGTSRPMDVFMGLDVGMHESSTNAQNRRR